MQTLSIAIAILGDILAAMNPWSRLLTVVFGALLFIRPFCVYSAFQEQWTYTHSPTGVYSGWRVAGGASLDSAGTIFVTGAYGSFSNTTAGFVFKLNTVGQLQWATDLGNLGTQSPSKAVIDYAGNVLVTAANDSFGTGYDYWTSKLCAEGELLWSARYHNSNAAVHLSYGDRPSAPAVDSLGNVYVTGRSYVGAPGTSSDIVTLKYNADGIVQWIRNYDSGGNPSLDAGYSVLVGSNDDITVVGVGSADFARDEVIVITYGGDGAQRRVVRHRLGAYGTFYPNTARLDAAGNVVVAGNSGGTYIVKFSPSGDLVWARSGLPSLDFVSMDLDSDGRILVFGISDLIMAYDPLGNEIWTTRVDARSAGGERIAGAWWQQNGSALAIGTSTLESGANRATVWRFDSAGNAISLQQDSDGIGSGVASRNGRIIFSGAGNQAFALAEYQVTAHPGQPQIIQPPSPMTAVEGDNAAFTVVAEGTGTLRYRWRRSGYVVDGATNATLVMTNLRSNFDGARVSVEVWNDLGRVVSPEVTLGVLVPPRLGSSYSFVAVAGETVTLTADSWPFTQPVTNQWFFEGSLLPANTNRLVLPSIQASHAGTYRAELRNVAGSATQEWRITISSPMPISGVAQIVNAAVTADLDLDQQGNAYITSSIRQNPNSYLLTAKYSSTGSRIWEQRFGGAFLPLAYGDAIKWDGTGGLYVAGRFGGNSVAVLKYAENGTLLWTNLLPIIPESTNARARLLLAPEGGCFVGITARMPTNMSKAVISLSRFDANGSNLWQTIINSTNASIGAFLSDMAALPDGTLAIVGQSAGIGLVSVITGEGDIVWQDQIERGGSFLSASLVAADNAGNCVVAGSTSPLENEIFLAKYSTDGSRLWFDWYPNDALGNYPSGLAIDSSQNVVLAVRLGWVTFLKVSADGTPIWTNTYAGLNFRGTMRLDAADNVHYVGAGFDLGFYFDYAAVKFDREGRLLALTRYRNTSLNSFRPVSFAVHTDASLYVAGIYNGSLELLIYGRQNTPTRLSLMRPDPTGRSALQLTGEPGFSYTVESAESLDSWHAWTNTVNLNGTVQLKLPTVHGRNFFRAVKNP
jgi:hypothetical protein